MAVNDSNRSLITTSQISTEKAYENEGGFTVIYFCGAGAGAILLLVIIGVILGKCYKRRKNRNTRAPIRGITVKTHSLPNRYTSVNIAEEPITIPKVIPIGPPVVPSGHLVDQSGNSTYCDIKTLERRTATLPLPPHPFLPNIHPGPVTNDSDVLSNRSMPSVQDDEYIMKSNMSGSYLSLLCEARDGNMASDYGSNSGLQTESTSFQHSLSATSLADNNGKQEERQDIPKTSGFCTVQKRPVPQPRNHVRQPQYANTMVLAKHARKIRKSICSWKTAPGTSCHGQLSSTTKTEHSEKRLAQIAHASGMSRVPGLSSTGRQDPNEAARSTSHGISDIRESKRISEGEYLTMDNSTIVANASYGQ